MAERYEPPERELLLTEEQINLVTEPTRSEIIRMLSQRPASITELAAVLDKPKGTVGHHVKALEDGGLIRVVRARKVRAVVEKFYGRVARTFVFSAIPGVDDHDVPPFIAEAIEETREPVEGEASLLTLRHARIPNDRIQEFTDRLMAIGEEFAGSTPGGSTTYGMLLGVYPTDRPSLPGTGTDREGDR